MALRTRSPQKAGLLAGPYRTTLDEVAKAKTSGSWLVFGGTAPCLSPSELTALGQLR